MDQQERYSRARKATLIGGVLNILLGFIKLIGGILFHSHALFADGIHSFSDLITDVMVLVASKYGSQDADLSHPYGHQRIETAATLLLALLLILAGTGIAWDSVHEIIYKTHDMPGIWTLPIALLSIVINEGLFHYTRRVGKHILSDLLMANAWHHRSDAASSIVVLVGLIGSLAGFVYLDAVAAVVVGLMIIQMGWSYGWSSVKELVDSGVDSQLLAQIEETIKHVDGVKKIHQLRTRMMGRDVFIDVHILVSPFISVSEGHYIAQHVHQALTEQLDAIKDVTVHVDPEDDEISCPSLHLPNRLALDDKLIRKWREAYPVIQSWVIHYLDGEITLDLFCESKFEHWDVLSNLIQNDLKQQQDITKIRLFSEHHVITLANLER